MKFIFIFAAIFSFATSQKPVEVLEVTVHCKLEVTSKIECFLPVDTLPTDIVKIVQSLPSEHSQLNHDEVHKAKELELNSMHMTEHMPFYVGHEFRTLEALWVIRSQLKYMTKQNFDDMLNLKALNLYENQISLLPFDVFHSLVNLEYLDLDNNQIAELPLDLFIYMPDLTVLRMRENNLENLSSETFKNNKNLEQIHLNGNKLKNIETDFSAMEFLVAVNLENNFGECDLSVGFYENRDEDKFESEIIKFQRKVEEKCQNN